MLCAIEAWASCVVCAPDDVDVHTLCACLLGVFVCSLRFRSPTDLFTLSDLHPQMTVSELKVLIESKIGIPTSLQRLYYSSPRRELFGRDNESVMSVLEVQSGEAPMTITVEIRKEATPSGASATSASAGGKAGVVAETDFPDEIGDSEDQFIAWLEPPAHGSIAQPHSAPAPAHSPPSTTAAMSTRTADDDDDGWGEDGGEEGGEGMEDGDGWDDDGGEDAFMDEEDETEKLEVVKKKQARENASAGKGNLMQSSKDNKKMGVYSILSLSDVMVLMKQQLSELQMINCSMSEAVILMRSYRWKKARLFEEYLGSEEEVQVKCGLTRMKHRADGHTPGAPSTASSSLGDCPLCGDEMTAVNSLDLGCTLEGSHRFCNGCWTNWCTAEMDKGPQALRTTCCSFKCGEIIPDDTMLSLLDLKKRRLFSRWSIRNFVDSVPSLKWCVNSRCNKVLQYSDGGARDVECECGVRFCFSLLRAGKPFPLPV